jgi:DNA-binding transcriptional regulator YdaS (Cro superfamily)
MSAIQNYLDEKKMSQTKFGEPLGVGQTMVDQWCKKRRPVSLEKALDIEKIYGIDARLLNDQVAIIADKFEDRRKRVRGVNKN